MENDGKQCEKSSDSVDVVDGVTASCLRRKRMESEESDVVASEESDGVAEYQRRFQEEVTETKNSKYSEYYSMDYTHKGYLLILAHSSFNVGDCYPRNAEIDIKVLEETFTRLGFEIEICRDKTLKEIRKIIDEVLSKDFEDYASLAIAVSSHGKSCDRIAAQDAIYDAQEVLFDPIKKIRTLFDKPKMFFIGTCRGHRIDRGTTLIGPMVETDSGALEEYKIPLEADVLKVYATVEGENIFSADHEIKGYIAYHNPCKYGSHFFKYLTEALNEYPDREILSILVIANRKIAINFTSNSREELLDNNKQCLCFMTTLCRLLKFRQ